MIKSNLLETKLYCPSVPVRCLQRPYLMGLLNEGLASGRQVTLVSAPPGFGKTTCISEWVKTLDRWPVTWLSLDAADNDPVRFLIYLIVALQKVNGNLGREIEGILHSGQLPSIEVLTVTLINDILKLESRLLLVLDDFQVIQDRQILQLLEYLITNMPQPLHLVLVTREDPPLPLARLRAHNRLTEIRAQDLRFTDSDAGYFLNKTMGLSLSPEDIAALVEKTEGWIVGLQLAALAIKSALSVRDQADPSDLIAALRGSHRFILSYLTEQVLYRQPQEIQRFLLQTSILEKLNGDLCNTVTGRSDGRALLERFFNANLFLIPLDDQGQWYRYHHLFADLLRDRLNFLHKDKIAELHQRAGQWYAQADMVTEAVRHALAAQDYAMTVELLEGYAMDLIMQGYAQTVNGWVQAIPPEWGSQSPRTNLAFAWMHLLRGAYAQASQFLERLKEVLNCPQLNEEESHSLKAEWLIIQSLILNKEGKTKESLIHIEKAMAISPENDNRIRSLAHFGLAYTYQVMNDFNLAMDAYQTAMSLGRAAENSVPEMLSTSNIAVMAFERGRLHFAFEIAAPVSERVEQSGILHPICTVVFGILGEIYYQWYQTAEARCHIMRALELSTLGGYESGIIGCHVLLSRLSLLEGDAETAFHEIRQAIECLQEDSPEYLRQETVSQQVRVFLALNRPAAAELALQREGFSFMGQFSFPALPPGRSITYSIGLLYNSSICLLLHRTRTGDEQVGLGQGIELADQMIAAALQDGYILIALETLLLRAQMQEMLGNHPAGQADYISALQLAEPEGIIAIFIAQGLPLAEALETMVKEKWLLSFESKYVERILSVFSGTYQPNSDLNREPDQTIKNEPESDMLMELLSDRELDVLRLMTKGLKYKEIASRLFISVNTVRFHVKAVYGKLNATNRTQAIEKARQMGIL